MLKANHDDGKGLWITELGWSSQPPTRNNLFAKGRSGQATQLKGAFSLLQGEQAKWRIQRVFWFSVDDQTGSLQLLRRQRPVRPGFQRKALLEGLRQVRRRHRGLIRPPGGGA